MTNVLSWILLILYWIDHLKTISYRISIIDHIVVVCMYYCCCMIYRLRGNSLGDSGAAAIIRELSDVATDAYDSRLQHQAKQLVNKSVTGRHTALWCLLICFFCCQPSPNTIMFKSIHQLWRFNRLQNYNLG